jgi:hypothetical protein
LWKDWVANSYLLDMRMEIIMGMKFLSCHEKENSPPAIRNKAPCFGNKKSPSMFLMSLAD